MHPFKSWLEQIFPKQRQDLLHFSEEFFVVFSRFEYALKQAGFVGGDSKKIYPEWDCFARRYEEKFREKAQNHPSVENAVDLFRQKPPRKQTLQDGQFKWMHTQEDQRVMDGKQVPTLQWLTVMVRRVRNNLFHGSKKMFGGRERDLELLKASLVLLRCWLDLDEDLKRHFTNGLPHDESLSVEFCSSTSIMA